VPGSITTFLGGFQSVIAVLFQVSVLFLDLVDLSIGSLSVNVSLSESKLLIARLPVSTLKVE
jgi:hypothetical protein